MIENKQNICTRQKRRYLI